MNIAIIGGTGTLGRLVAGELKERGHDVRAISRSSSTHRTDLRTGEGLEAALAGCEVVVDASNDHSKDAAGVLVDGTRRLLAAEQAAGVQHHVGVSIVGCELMPDQYSRAKAEQEQVVERAPVPWSLVRSTQFHEYLSHMLDGAARWRLLPIPRVPLQTVAAAEAAAAIAEVAQGDPLLRPLVVGGPEVLDARACVRAWRSASARRVLVAPLPLPGRLGRLLRDGALLAERPDVRGRLSFTTWLTTARP